MEPPDPPSRRPTSTPSWVMVGFILGALAVLAFPRRRSPPPPAPSQGGAPAPLSAPRPADAPQLTTIEAVFAHFGQYAVWDHDTTEVALWNSGTRSFSDDYEVLRVGDVDYFRTIPRLTRPILTHGVPDDPSLPLQYTEPQAQRDLWLKQTGRAGWDALRQALGGAAPPTPEPPSK